MKALTFKDRVVLYVSAGDGGNGCSSFRREKFVPLGGPDGGDGGRGGHVYLVADKNVGSLLPLYYRPHQRAKPGGKGMPRKCHGRNGEDLYVKVPLGTEVHLADAPDGESLLGEVMEEQQTLMIAKGGGGGKGNVHYATSSYQAPSEFTPGTEGEQKKLRLDLKLVADVGLVGYPNAGKSTLLRAISAAKPKTAAYPFTTLNPIIGTIEWDHYQTLKVADIPGLIDGAHLGVGLGHDFLRHIERTRFLLFIIDLAGVDGRDPAEDYFNLRKELRLYREDLDHRPYLVLANKTDLPEAQEQLDAFKLATGENPLCISAADKTGIPPLKEALFDHFHSAT